MKKYFFFCLFFFSSAFATDLDSITTIEEGVLKVGVTSVCKDETPHHNCWIYKIFSRFAEQNNLSLEFIPMIFDDSWKLADANKADIIATGVSRLAEREPLLGEAKFSNIYFIVKRGIKIKREDEGKFKTIQDFVGYSLAAGKGMTSETDLRRRAVEGITIVTPDTWDEVYELFTQEKVAGIAEGFYFFPDNNNYLNEDEKTLMVDVHDLESGKTEGLGFVVRNKSANLLGKVNEHIKTLGLPNRIPK